MLPNPLRSLLTNLNPLDCWTPDAEQINGRFAMIGFVGLLVLELLTNQGFLAWLSLLE